MKPEKGTFVKRSTYQKVVEENKRLLIDIKILTEEQYDLTGERILLKMKWQKKFKEERELNALIKDACVQYLKDHPEYDISKPKP